MSKPPAETEFAKALLPYLDPPQIKEDETYYAALGKFIAAYALAETEVHQLARYLTGISDAKARILFAGSRIGDVQTRVRALLSVTRRSSKIHKQVEDCFAQFDLIGLRRDKMVHRYVNYQNGGLYVSNALTAKSLASVEHEIFSKHDFDCMQCDCLLICVRLLRIRNSKPFKNGGPGMRKVLTLPWFYKPPPRQSAKKESRVRLKTAKAQHRPRSSQP